MKLTIKQAYNKLLFTCEKSGQCLETTQRSYTKNGYKEYPKIWDGKKHIRGNRLVWQYYNGIIPEGLCILHTCDNPWCVNINHLFIGTQKNNAQDRENKGRGNKATGDNNGARVHPEKLLRGINHPLVKNPKLIPHNGNHPSSKLIPDEVRYIRKNFKLGCKVNGAKSLARKFNVSDMTIHKIIKNKSWKHLDGN